MQAMSKTEIIKSLPFNLSLTALNKRINKIPNFKRFIKNGKIIPKGIKLISYPKQNSTSKIFRTRRGIKNHQPTKDWYRKRLVKAETAMLNQSSTIKSQQITIEKLTKYLNQNQEQSLVQHPLIHKIKLLFRK